MHLLPPWTCSQAHGSRGLKEEGKAVVQLKCFGGEPGVRQAEANLALANLAPAEASLVLTDQSSIHGGASVRSSLLKSKPDPSVRDVSDIWTPWASQVRKGLQENLVRVHGVSWHRQTCGGQLLAILWPSGKDQGSQGIQSLNKVQNPEQPSAAYFGEKLTNCTGSRHSSWRTTKPTIPESNSGKGSTHQPMGMSTLYLARLVQNQPVCGLLMTHTFSCYRHCRQRNEHCGNEVSLWMEEQVNGHVIRGQVGQRECQGGTGCQVMCRAINPQPSTSQNVRKSQSRGYQGMDWKNHDFYFLRFVQLCGIHCPQRHVTVLVRMLVDVTEFLSRLAITLLRLEQSLSFVQMPLRPNLAS